MRRLLLVFGGAGIVVAALLVAAAVVLPRYVDDPAVRERIREAAKRATGREVGFASLSAGLFPPRVELRDPEVAGDEAGAPPLFAASRVSLRVAWLPLLSGAVVLDSLEVEGARLHLVRHPAQAARADAPPDSGAPERSARPSDAGPPPAPDAGDSAAEPTRLGVERVDVVDARVVVEDRTRTPPATLAIDDLDVRARRPEVFDPVSFEATAKLAEGGDVRIEGTIGADAAIEAKASLDRVNAGAFAPWLSSVGRGAGIAGLVAGELRASALGREPKRIVADLVLDDAKIDLESVRLLGRLTVTAELEGGAAGLGGPFRVDATQAELSYGGGFRKPPGTEATTSGTLETAPDGSLSIDELHVKIKNFDARGSLRTGQPTSLLLDADAFELAGFESLVPALSNASLGGQSAIEGLRIERPGTPLAGAVRFEAATIAAKGRPPIVVDGALVGAGDALVSRALSASVAGKPIAIELRVAPIGEGATLSLEAAGSGIDSAALLAALTEKRPGVSGPLRLDARFRVPVGTGAPPLRAVSGNLDFEIAPGRFEGVSLLEDTIERSGPIVQAAVAAGKAFGGRDVQRMYSDEFERVSAHVTIADGQARFDPLRVVHEAHRIDLVGRVDLETRTLDASGRIVFPDEKSAGALRGQTIRISRVAGPLDRPKVELSQEDVAAVVAKVGGSVIEKKVDRLLEKLGEKGGRSPLDAIQGFLEGKRRN